jgi:hypothetical protein
MVDPRVDKRLHAASQLGEDVQAVLATLQRPRNLIES